VQPQPSATGGRPDEPATGPGGRCVGNSYILVCPVGRGATGTVWRGIERTSGEQVAVKLLHEGLLRHPKVVTRFVQERTILMLVRHEHIVRVRDLFSAGGTLGLVMDFVTGGSLRERLRADGPQPAAEAARLLAQVAAALAEAHGLGVVHRDVKPDNILLQAVGGRLDVRLTDFGIARVIDAPALTTSQAIIGTPYYMAPEVINGGAAGPAADVYALGVVLYELLSGRTPYAGEAIAVLQGHLDDPPGRPDGLPDRIWSVVESCLGKDPARRPTATDLATTLRGLARPAALDGPAPPTAADGPARPAAAGDGLVQPAADGDGAAAAGGDPPRPAVLDGPGDVVSGGRAPRRRRPDNRRRSWVWRRPGAIVALVAGAAVVAGIGGYQAWNPRDGSTGHAAVGSAPGAPRAALGSAPAPDRSAGHGSPATVTPAAVQSGAPSAAARVRASGSPVDVPLPPAAGAAGADPAYGPWQCGDRLTWDVGHPVLAQPCHALGDTIRVLGHLTAAPGVQADVTLTVRDVESGATAAGPYTCGGLLFTDLVGDQTCGPVDLLAPRGRRYVVVEDWRYTGQPLLPGGRTTGPEFAW